MCAPLKVVEAGLFQPTAAAACKQTPCAAEGDAQLEAIRSKVMAA